MSNAEVFKQPDWECWDGYSKSVLELVTVAQGQQISLQTFAHTKNPQTLLEVRWRSETPGTKLIAEDGLSVKGDTMTLLGSTAVYRNWQYHPDLLHRGLILPGEYLTFAPQTRPVILPSVVRAWKILTKKISVNQ